MDTQRPILIIGTGLAGYLLAKALRALGNPQPLCLVTESHGFFYSKPLLSTALTRQKTPDTLPTDTAEAMAQALDARIRTNTRITHLDTPQRIAYADTTAIPYDRCVFACGATPNLPTIPGATASDLITINQLEDYRSFCNLLPSIKKITILGAGFVGCEFAHDLITNGYEVDLIDTAPHPLSRLLPSEIGTALQEKLAETGIRWHMQQTITQLQRSDNGYRLTCADDTAIDTDLILSAIGLRPNLALAKAADIDTHTGIVVDAGLRTSDAHCYALGDCAEIFGRTRYFIAPLRRCVATLAHNLTHPDTPTTITYPPMPVSLKTPSCPLVIATPAPEVENPHWVITGSQADRKALCYDAQKQLCGFVLMGDCVQQRAELTKTLSAQF